MTRILIISLFSLITAFSFSQLSLSVGISKRNDCVFDPDAKNLFDQLFMNCIDERFRNDYYSISINHQKKNLLLIGELCYNYSAFSAMNYLKSGQYSHNYSHTEVYERYFDIKYSFVGIKLSPNVAFTPQSKFNLAVGPFIQMDYLSAEEESNHHTIHTVTSSSWGTNQNGPYNYTNQSVDYSDEEFNGYTVYGAHASLGFSFRPRFIISNFTIEIASTFGFNLNPRFQENYGVSKLPDKFEMSRLFTEIGFRVGYIVKRYDKGVNEDKE